MTKTTAILASAYNVFGPQSGEAARPDTVLAMASRTDLRRMAGLYLERTREEGRNALFTVAEVDEAIASL